MATNDSPGERLVWDLPLRVFHWGIVLCFAASWATHELGTQWFEWHVRSGYAMLVLVAFRLAWGFLGPRHARFASFVRGPGATLAYLRGLARRDGATTPGHNPLGALAVLAMLALLAAQAVTGLFANDEIFNTGPLYGYVSDGLSDRLTGLHKQGFDLLLVLAGLHLAALAFYALWKRSHLVRAMITGRKPATQVPDGAGIEGERVGLAPVLVGVAALALWWVFPTAPPPSMSFF